MPDQAPDATQEVALLEDQMSVVMPPFETLVRFEFSVTVGRKLARTLESVIPPEDPQALRSKMHTSVSGGARRKEERRRALRCNALNGEFIWGQQVPAP
jgi:hypothetical protein